MHLSLQEYLRNPQGKGSVSLGLSSLKLDYNKRYNDLLDKHKTLTTTVYKDKNDYLIHVKLPSESYDGIIYDMIIRFSKTSTSNIKDILNWDIQVMTNSPSFNFTYANIFKSNRLLIEELKFMVDNEAYANKPKVRNPYMLLGPEKNLYFTMMYIKEKYSLVYALDNIAVKYNIKTLKADVMDIGKIMDLIEISKAKKRQIKKEAREQQQRDLNVIRKLQSDKQITRTQNIAKASIVKPIRATSKTATTKTVKKAKKI